MDMKTPTYVQSPAAFPSIMESPFVGNRNPFEDNFPDAFCNTNLKDSSDFLKDIPMPARSSVEAVSIFEGTSSAQRREGGNAFSGQRRIMEAPPTPGRPVFSFSVGNHSRKSFPSKWDDAQKWLVSSSSCHGSPAPQMMKAQEPPKILLKHNETAHQKEEIVAEKCRVTDEKVTRSSSVSFNGPLHLESSTSAAFHGASSEVLLKDKFTDNVEPFYSNFKYGEAAKEGFLFRNSLSETMKDAATEVISEAQHRDIGTEMTPIGSSTTSRSHTPFKSSSPARHNTPASRSGPLEASNVLIDIAELQDCHLAKIQFNSVATANWSSREEEDEEISKSLRHFEMDDGKKNFAGSRTSAWEEEEKNKSCLRYQREEAKIQAWVNLQSAKAEAQARKLEVKIQKMRSNLEEKLMRRMAVVHRKAEEWRASAQLLHSQQLRRASQQSQKMKNQHNTYLSRRASCGCFPCSNHI